MMKEAYTTSELAPILAVSRQAADLRATRENWASRPRPGRGGGNEWLTASMPEATRASIQAALAEQLADSNVPAVRSGTDITIPGYAWNRGKARLRIVTEWRRQVSQGKAKGVKKGDTTEKFLVAARSGLLFPQDVLEAAGGLSAPTLYLWNKTLHDNDDAPEALADGRGGWRKGPKKGCQLSELASQSFLAVYLKGNRPPLKRAYDAMSIVLERAGERVPSMATVRRWFEAFDAVNHGLVVWMREGEKVYEDLIGPFLSREDSILEVGDVLVADGHKFNFLVRHPETGKPCRMTLIGWEDWASRMFVGFEIMVSENTQAIASSLFRAIINLGKLPQAVAIDNGKAFKNEFFDGKADLEDNDGLYARLKIHVQHSRPYCARTKNIERWWGDFDRQCEITLPSYTGASIEGKPAHMARNEKWHKKQHEKDAYVPTVEDVVRIVTEYAKWKAMQPHPTRPGTTPWEVFMAGRGEGFPVEEAEKLSRHFLHRKAIWPKRCRFRLMGVEFESDALHGINKELTAHFSHSSLAEVYVYDGPYLLCTARPIATYHPMAALLGTDLDVAKVKEALKRQAALRRETRRQATALAEWSAPSDAVNAFPWMLPASERKTPLVLHDRTLSDDGRGLRPDEPAAISDADRAAITARLAECDAREAARPAYKAPAFFSSNLERYEFLFLMQYEQKHTLTEDDAAFMARFEASPEYGSASRRYDNLRKFYGQQKESAV